MSAEPGYRPGRDEVVTITALRRGKTIYEWPALVDTSEEGRLAKLRDVLQWANVDEVQFTTARDFWAYMREEA